MDSAENGNGVADACRTLSARPSGQVRAARRNAGASAPAGRRRARRRPADGRRPTGRPPARPPAAPSGDRTASPRPARRRAAGDPRAARARAGRRRRRRCRRCRASPRAVPGRSRAARARRGRPRPRAASRAASADRRAAASVTIWARRSPLVQEVALRGGIRVADLDGHQEPVELRLGQRIRADLFDRILRRDDEERLRQLARLPVLRDLALLHRLEQRALRLRRGAVDLVGEHDRREDRARMEAEGPRFACRRSRRPARRPATGRS